MFARGLFRARYTRRAVSTLAALLAFVGGVLVLVGSLGGGTSIAVLPALLSLGAFLGALGIYRAGKAFLFPRARLVTAGFLTAAIGFVLLILGHGLDATLILVGGLIAWFATVL